MIKKNVAWSIIGLIYMNDRFRVHNIFILLHICLFRYLFIFYTISMLDGI